MTLKPCAYAGDRDATLIAYLYGEIDAPLADTFEAHLVTCAECSAEIESLRGVRSRLAHWNPPEPSFAVTGAQPRAIGQSAIRDPQSAIRDPQSAIRNPPWWAEIPAWAQVAAALLVLGVSAGVANLNVHYDNTGLTIRTGWSQPAVVPPAGSQPGAARLSPAATDVVLKSDLASLEQQLRDLRSAQAAFASPVVARPAATRPGGPDAELLLKVRALVEASERRQQRELALRVAQVITDVNAQRRADLQKIDVSLIGVQRDLGVEVLKQRQQVNYLMRVNQR
jgi:hypothetical protein